MDDPRQLKQRNRSAKRLNRSRVTLSVLSEKTGFDKSTISRVLRDDATLSIRPENLALIKNVASDLGYVPDTAARSLRLARSYSIGAIVPSLQNPIHAQIVEAVQSTCQARGYSLLISYIQLEESTPTRLQAFVQKHRVDGLLVHMLRYDASFAAEMRRFPVPVMMVNRLAEGVANSITVDDRSGGALATQHLLDLGHRQIAHLSVASQRFNAHQRFLGYRDALKAAGVPYDPDLVVEAGYDFADGVAATEALLKRRRGGFTAVFGVTLMAAAGSMNVLRRHGIEVPRNVSVMGFHDGLLAQVLTPALSTIAYPLFELGKAAADGIIDLVEGKRNEVVEVLATGVVVPRQSTAPALPRTRT
jgi:LacI family transcriptional regulator